MIYLIITIFCKKKLNSIIKLGFLDVAKIQQKIVFFLKIVIFSKFKLRNVKKPLFIINNNKNKE